MSDSQTTRSMADLIAVLRDVLEAIDEHVAYRDDLSLEKLERRAPWVREIINDES